MTKKIIIMLTILCVGSVPSARANIEQGVSFNQSHMEGGRALQLLGTATKRLMFMELFVAGFYLDKDVERTRALEDVGKRVEISYFKSVSAQTFINFVAKRMKKNMTPMEYKQVEDRVTSLETLFVDLDAGDLFTMTYIPGTGTRFEHNGRILGTVPGADFGKGIFATWVGERPFDKAVKRKVLGLDPSSN